MDESGEKVITLDCSEDGGVELSQEEATVFVIVVSPTPFESGFTVTITDDEDNAETFSASAGTSVERSVITVMPEIDLDEEEEITTSAYLPDGETFNSTVDAFMNGKGITAIKFITNSATTSENALVDGSIYLVQNGQTLEIHTAASQFMANGDCRIMFHALEGWDSSTQQDIYNSFGQIQVIDFGDNFNTQNVTNMGGMFYYCTGLTSLDLSNFDTQNVTDMLSMFRDCSSLTSLDLSNFNTQNVTDMHSMFRGCTSLTSLDVSNFETQNVTDMTAMFSNCSNLTSLDLSNFYTQNVTVMEVMFRDCSSLTSLDLSNFDTQNVTDMSYMFCNCSSLTSLDVSNFNTQNVTDMGRMFWECRSLTSLDLSNFDTQNVTDMWYMFSSCRSLTLLDLSNFDTKNVIDMWSMFSSCISLTSLDLSNFTFESNPDVYSMFSSTGSNATNKPIPIYVSAEGKRYIESEGDSSINSNYATLTIKAPQTE
ncbi:MAG: BspA family leucine-rich repeat surface protein [Bacteroidales bacterium]|nr:BspA family leucine-rich repeat surface protein [Bacteroidales bacterium]